MRGPETVLVTGAGGFIGGRAVEILWASGRATVRAAVRRWSSGARIGRFPIEIVRCNVTDPPSVAAAMRGVGAVLHCARGDARVNVHGTRTVLAAALKAGVRCVIHLSTIEVYGEASGEVAETHPLAKTGRPYGDSKIDAEVVCQEFCRRGLPVVILRPTVVYGPFSDLWTIEFAERFRTGRFPLPERDCRGGCNLVYVDDVVGAMLAALEADGAVGEAFNVNGPDRVTWNDYIEALNAALGLPPLRRDSHTSACIAAHVMLPVRATAKAVLRRFQRPIMALYQRSDLAKRLMRRAEARIREAPTTAEFRLYSRKAYYSNEKLRRVLGYRPVFAAAEGIALSAAWLRFHRYV